MSRRSIHPVCRTESPPTPPDRYQVLENGKMARGLSRKRLRTAVCVRRISLKTFFPLNQSSTNQQPINNRSNNQSINQQPAINNQQSSLNQQSIINNQLSINQQSTPNH